MAFRSYTVALAYTAPAGGTFQSAPAYVYPHGAPGAVRHLTLILPPGSQGMLQLVPRVVGRAGAPASLVPFGSGVAYLSGDDATMELDADFPLYTGDTIQAWYQNTDTVNPHFFTLLCTIGGRGA